MGKKFHIFEKSLPAGRQGFTIIEVMVSVAIFSVVMVVALGALLAMSQSDSRAELLKSAVNSLNFALDEISRTARTGTAYDCAAVLPLSGSPAPHDCTGTPASSFAYIASDGTWRGYCLGSNGSCVGAGTVQCALRGILAMCCATSTIPRPASAVFCPSPRPHRYKWGRLPFTSSAPAPNRARDARPIRYSPRSPSSWLAPSTLAPVVPPKSSTSKPPPPSASMINKTLRKIKRAKRLVLSLSKGFTIIETLIAILILTTAIAGLLTIAAKGLTTAIEARDQLTAFTWRRTRSSMCATRATPTRSGDDWLTGERQQQRGHQSHSMRGVSRLRAQLAWPIGRYSTRIRGDPSVATRPTGGCATLLYDSGTGTYDYASTGGTLGARRFLCAPSK